jgi:transposase
VRSFLVPIHQLKRTARSLSRINRFVTLNDQGYSYEEIAKRESCSTRTVERGIRHFVEVTSRYPTGLDATEVQRRRAEDVHNLEECDRQLVLSLTHLSEPTCLADELEIVRVKTQVAAARCKIVEQKSKLTGTYVPVVKTPDITNNTLMLNAGATEEDQLRALIAYRSLQNARQ